MLNTTKSPSDAIMSIPEILERRLIRYIGSDGEPRFFGIKRAYDLVRYFEAEPAANSVTYDALLQFGSKVLDGSFTITRNGDLICQIAH